MLVAETCTGRRPGATLPWEINHPRGRVVKITSGRKEGEPTRFRIYYACGCKHEASRAEALCARGES